MDGRQTGRGVIRPEAMATLIRWREPAFGVAALILGLWLGLTGYGLPRLFGFALVALGLVMGLSGLRRALFPAAEAAPGMVEVDEARITYLAPVMGGAVALDDMLEVALRRMANGEAFWRLTPFEGPPLMIPTGAAGAEGLLDALAPLPGFDGGAMVRAARGGNGAADRGTVIVWRRYSAAALTPT